MMITTKERRYGLLALTLGFIRLPQLRGALAARDRIEDLMHTRRGDWPLDRILRARGLITSEQHRQIAAALTREQLASRPLIWVSRPA